MELARQTILIRELFADYQKNNPVTDAEIQGRVRQVRGGQQRQGIQGQPHPGRKGRRGQGHHCILKKGGKFEDIAKKQSKDPGSGAKGGDLDWANPASYVPEFTEALIKLKKGKMTETPVKSQFGWHVIRLDDVRQAQLPKLEEVKPQVAQQLQQQKLAKFQEELRAKAKVE
jgi:peptidyl-prolyl cis-trans isomerase C